MCRRLFNALAALSLLLCIGLSTLWLRSYWWQEKMAWTTKSGYRSIWTANGSLELGFFQAENAYKPNEIHGPRYTRDRAISPLNWLMFHDYTPPAGPHIDWQLYGFDWNELRESATGQVDVFASVPFWSLVLFASLLPLTWAIIRYRSHSRRDLGLCPICGYDLRATPTRCPECGTTTS